MRFVFADVDEYVRWAAEVGGPLAPVIRGLAEGELETIKAQLEKAFIAFAEGRGYQLPGLCLNAVAS